ncbi:MAG: hypothetical protein M3065_14590, partial [Actinomycetota bacterium]|nr:hypothetical protein [Actinomycetota bacterium]
PLNHVSNPTPAGRKRHLTQLLPAQKVLRSQATPNHRSTMPGERKPRKALTVDPTTNAVNPNEIEQRH